MLVIAGYYVLPTLLVLYGIRKLRERKWGKCTNNVQLDGKVAIITGANCGIGYEIAKELASRNAQVILACRNMDKAVDAVNRIKKKLNPSPLTLTPMVLDLASLKSIKQFSENIKANYPHVHLLINNAGVSYPRKSPRIETEDRFEIHFAVNYLGHFYLTNLLLPILPEKESRVVIVSSSLHEKGKIDLHDLNRLKGIENTNLYADSKLACVYFGMELAKRTKGKTNIYTCCPGWVYTSLFRHSIKWFHYLLISPIAFFYMRSPKQGAQTPIYCATQSELLSESGFLYRDCKRYKSQLTFHDKTAAELWEKSSSMINAAIQN